MTNLINSIRRFIRNLSRPSKSTNLKLLQKKGESVSDFTIREAVEADIPVLAALHLKTWNETYPHARKKPTYKFREHQWRDQFAEPAANWFCFVIEKKNGSLIGFAKGKKRTAADHPGVDGELNKIYILRDYQRLELGKKLVGYVARKFQQQGIKSMVLFGVSRNPSCKFYEALGGKRLLSRRGHFHGGYSWPDIDQLAAECQENNIPFPQ